jgi:hypothetical protein
MPGWWGSCGPPRLPCCRTPKLEARLAVEGRELQRQLLQDHLDLRAVREAPLVGVCDRDGAPRPSVEAGHERGSQDADVQFLQGH